MLALEGNVLAFIVILYILWSVSVVCINIDFKVKSGKWPKYLMISLWLIDF